LDLKRSICPYIHTYECTRTRTCVLTISLMKIHKSLNL